jgi:hypothetical protein
MKTIKLMTVAMMMLFFTSNSINAQVSVNINIGTPPVWAPVNSTADFYYIPDIQSYYDVRATQFIYLHNGVWIRSGHLPQQYRSYDLNRGYKVVLNDYHGSRPYDNYKSHKVKYYKGYNGHPKKVEVNEYHDNGNQGNDKHNDDHGNDHKDKGNNGKGNKHGH